VEGWKGASFFATPFEAVRDRQGPIVQPKPAGTTPQGMHLGIGLRVNRAVIREGGGTLVSHRWKRWGWDTESMSVNE
jgi:hypothetical protein